MRFISIVLLDHNADLGGVMDIEELCSRACDEVGFHFGVSDEEFVEIAWVASEALNRVEVLDDQGDECPTSWYEAREEFLADRPFISQALGEERSEHVRRHMLPAVITALAAELAAGQEKIEILAENLRSCADWLETGLPGVLATKSVNRYSGRNYDLRRDDKPKGPGVLVKVYTPI